jgi:peptidyl-prolyl cis-trans isomerase SurA
MKRVLAGITTAVAVLSLALSAFALPPAQAGDVIDRIVATVNGHIILQSDLDEALRYESVLNGRSPAQFTEEERSAVLDRLIDQELLAEQTSSALFRHASESDAAAQIAEARKQYPEAATAEGWQSLLARFQLTENDLVAHVQQQMDLMRLVEAHFRPAVQIDAKSIETYYREKFVPQLKQSSAADVPTPDVSAKIRELLTQEKVNQLLVSWLQTLRSESKVSLPGASQGAQAQ